MAGTLCGIHGTAATTVFTYTAVRRSTIWGRKHIKISGGQAPSQSREAPHLEPQTFNGDNNPRANAMKLLLGKHELAYINMTSQNV